MKLNYYLRGLGLGILVTALILGLSGQGSGKKTMTDSEIKKRAMELGMIENTVLTEPSEGTNEKEQEPEQTDGLWEKIEDESETVDVMEIADAAPINDKPETVDEPEESDEKVLEEIEEPDESSESERDNEPESVDEEIQEDGAETALPEEGEDGDGKKDGIKDKINETQKDESKGAGDTEDDAETEGASPAVQGGEQITGVAGQTVVLTIVHGDSSYTVARKLHDMGVVPSVEEYDRYLCQNGYDKTIRTGTYEIEAGTSLEQIAKMINGK